MKKPYIYTILLIFISLILPIALGLCNPLSADKMPESSDIAPEGSESVSVSCLNAETNTVSLVSLEEYLVGVLAAEMPANYEFEALKAQAVAARSYILSRTTRENPDHPTAAICTSPIHCKGWLSEADAKANWKTEEQLLNWEKLKAAVDATRGEYMIHDDAVVEAFFFSSGGGRTENSEDVWQAELPYLRSVESPEIPSESLSQISFSNSEFIRKINPYMNEPLATGTVPIISDVSRTDGGSVASLTVCGKVFRGTQIRSIFGLKSANFTVIVEGDSVRFDVIGSGHGVGMSQKGANLMAKNGKKYTEILSHYYTNIQIAKM